MGLGAQLSVRTEMSPAGLEGLSWQEASMELALEPWGQFYFPNFMMNTKAWQGGVKGR